MIYQVKPGQILRKLRQEKKMTQAQLARELGVSEFTVCRYETGRLKMSAEAIRKAAAVFDACPVYFLEGTHCTLGADAELVDLFRRADRLAPAQRETVKRTLKALLDSFAPPSPENPPKEGE
ncbi:MAG: helix-turn-helix transcriptional regulator [Bacillota bacterium]